jgi:YD repeat-containing protein
VKLWCALALVVVSGCLCGRANPRLVRVDAQTSGGEASAEFVYDDDGRLAKVNKEIDGGQNTLISMRWEDDTLTEVTTSTGEGTLASNSIRQVMHHEEGRLVLVENDDGSTTFAYDDEGRLASYDQDRTNNAGAVIASHYAFSYGDDGAIDGFSVEQKSGDVTATSTFVVKHADGRVVQFNGTFDAGKSVQDATYDDQGRLARFQAKTTFEDNPDANEDSDTKYTYGDDGLLAKTETDGTLGHAELRFTYESGDARALDVTSSIAYPMLLWDMRGVSYPGYDEVTQPARFVMADW